MDEGTAMARYAYYGITTAEDEEEAERMTGNLTISSEEVTEITISSRTGLQRIVVTRTGSGVSIATYGNKGGRISVHIFEECVPELVEALRQLGLIRQETKNTPEGLR